MGDDILIPYSTTWRPSYLVLRKESYDKGETRSYPYDMILFVLLCTAAGRSLTLLVNGSMVDIEFLRPVGKRTMAEVGHVAATRLVC